MKPFKKSKEPIPLCKLCFHPINNNNAFAIFEDFHLCRSCYLKLEPKFIRFNIDKYRALAIYEYDENIKSILYQFKGCFDIELREIFLDRYIRELSIYYAGYYKVYIPSSKEDDDIREFNHVEEMFSKLKLKELKLLEKIGQFKQAANKKQQRSDISKHLRLIKELDLHKKNILIVDDVFTTGSTINAAIKLLEQCHPKSISILVMSKTPDKKNN